MSNARPTPAIARVVATDGQMTTAQYRQYRKIVNREESQIIGHLPESGASGVPVRRSLAEARAIRSGILADNLRRSTLLRYVAIRCQPERCPRGHLRARLHSVPRSDVDRVARAFGQQLGLLR
jgi:hypothetical protein